MSSEWLKLKLGELCAQQGGAIMTGPFGSQLHTADYKVEGTPVVMPTNIVGSRVTEEGIARIDKADAERLSQHKLRIGDLVFSRRGDVTKNALVRAREVGWLCGTGCLKVRLGNESLASAEFVSYYLQLPEIKEWLIQHAVGATMPNLNTGILSAVPLVLAPPETQKKIVCLLSALDASILTLQQQNTALESLAQTLFRSWFVDFDPVHAKAAGNAPEAMSPELAALFPSEFENSKQGLIPMGWPVTPFSQTVSIYSGGTPKTSMPEYWSGDIPWFSVTDAPSDGQVFVLNTDKKITKEGLANSPTKLLPRRSTIISARGTVGKIAMVEGPMTMNQSCYALAPKRVAGEYWVYFETRRLVTQLKQMAHGGVFDTITKSTFDGVSVVAPSDAIQLRFSQVCQPIFDAIANNGRLVATLSQLRDHLLPRLISGKLRIEDAEALVAELA